MSPDELTDPVAFLTRADVELEGRMPWSSNATFLATLRGDVDGTPIEQQAIYKPVRGERPLWDFEPGLHRRERAMYVLSERLGLGLVPPTVIRHDGPLGEGSFQWFVDADHGEHYFTVYEQRAHLRPQLAALAVLDVLANNTDRKSGHCLYEPPRDGRPDRVWAIDNGLCFAAEYKVRTVIWEFAGDPIDDDLLARIAPMCECVDGELAELLAADEVAAMQRRATALVAGRVLPDEPTSYRSYPWPLV